MMNAPLPMEAEQMLQAELNRDERLLWAGQPIAGRAGKGSLGIVLFGVPWTAFAIFWTVTAFWMTNKGSSSTPLPFRLFFPLFGVPFVLVGVWMLTTPFRMRNAAQKTVYALTDKRALILTPAWRSGVSVRTIAPEELTDRTRTQDPDGSGTITFNRLTTMQHRSGHDSGTYNLTVGFENIPDVRDVDSLIDRTFAASFQN